MFVLSIVRSRIFAAAFVLGAALLVAAACGGNGDSGKAPVDDEASPDGEATVEITMVPTFQFDTTEMTIAAGTEVTVIADNADTGIPHNFAVYATAEAAARGEGALAATRICNAPCTDTATLNLSPGEYFFRCDVHPQQMIGTLIVG